MTNNIDPAERVVIVCALFTGWAIWQVIRHLVIPPVVGLVALLPRQTTPGAGPAPAPAPEPLAPPASAVVSAPAAVAAPVAIPPVRRPKPRPPAPSKPRLAEAS